LSQINFRDFYNYPGSFTTPPCTEGINWFILKEIQTISKAQFDSFNRLWAGNATFADGNGNNRLVQALGERTLIKSKYNITSL
jgi:carbonic anhydrase